MPLDTAILAADLDHMIADMPATIRYKAKEIPCAAMDMGQPVTIEDMVISRTRDIMIVANLNDFTSLPEREHPCQFQYFGGKFWLNFFIDNVQINDDRQGVTLKLRANQDNPAT